MSEIYTISLQNQGNKCEYIKRINLECIHAKNKKIKLLFRFKTLIYNNYLAMKELLALFNILMFKIKK